MFLMRGDSDERRENHQGSNTQATPRLTTEQKIVTLPDIVTERFDDIVEGLSTGPDPNSYIPEQCRKCPLLAGIIEALKMALAQKEALERTALETADNITTWLRVQGASDEEIEQILEDPERLKEAQARYSEFARIKLDIGDAALNQLLPGIERQTAGCPGIIKCISLDGKTVARVCGSPAMQDGKNREATVVDRTGRGEQDPPTADTPNNNTLR